MSKIVAVGDIHADFGKLHDVLGKLDERVDFDETPLVFLGDIVDGGHEAKQCISTLMSLQTDYPHFKFLLGNHEDLMLNALGAQKTICSPYVDVGNYDLWYFQGGKETYHSYLVDSLLSEYERAIAQPLDFIDPLHIEWLKSLELWYESNSFIFVHAGLKPKTDLKHSRPVDLLWIRDEFIRSDFNWGKIVVAGHTHQGTHPTIMKNKFLIDTMHHGHGVLTAVILDDNSGELIETVQSYNT